MVIHALRSQSSFPHVMLAKSYEMEDELTQNTSSGIQDSRPSEKHTAVIPPSAMLQVMIAESYGGRDEPVDTLVGSFVDISVQTSMEPLRIKETPTENTYQVLTLLTIPGSPCPLPAIPFLCMRMGFMTSARSCSFRTPSYEFSIRPPHPCPTFVSACFADLHLEGKGCTGGIQGTT